VKDAFVFGNIKFRDKISIIFSRKYRFFAKNRYGFATLTCFAAI
jgi:hypothetical protein